MLLPDHDGSVHGDLSADRVRALCDRRAGIGGDGVLRVIRRRVEPGGGREWFMDYRNSDGSVSEMCGNGIRVFARHLAEEGLADPAAPIPIGTRDGVKMLTFDGDLITADMGTPKVLGETTVSVGDAHLAGAPRRHGQPARGRVRRLARRRRTPARPAGATTRRSTPRASTSSSSYAAGTRHVAMRVHERGSGETRSCGTGACAVMVAAAAGRRRADRDTAPTASTSPAAPSPSPGPPTTGSC